MIDKVFAVSVVSLLAISLMAVPAFAFEPSLINVTIQDSFVTEYPDYDIITAIFSVFNGDSQPAEFTGHNMMYLNDTNGDWWEYSNHIDHDSLSSTECPDLGVTVHPGNSTDVRLCYLVIHDDTVGYSLIVNNDANLMDMDIQEFTLESVPQWFNATANSWCNDAITESEFTNSTQSYIQNGNIKVLRGVSGIDNGTQTPAWVKGAACDWSNNLISDYEFLDGIYWLIDNGKVLLQ